MKVTEPISIGTNNEGKKIFIKRPCKKFADIAAYQEAFAAEATQGMGWAHPNLLNYISLQMDEQGWYITFEYTPAVPLNRALLDGVLQINTVTEFKQIMNQLMDAVAYLHSRNICHLDLRPENIFITKGTHDVLLANPANIYVSYTPSFFIFKEKYAAPELFKENTVPTLACDIYSLGKVMEYLYSYSHLSPGIRYVIFKATHPEPAKRYANVEEMKKAFGASRYIDRSVQVIKGIAAVTVILLAYYGLREEPADKETLQFIEEVKHINRQTLETTDNRNRSYSIPLPSDSIRPLPTDTLEFNPEEHRKLAERIFKKEFRRRAENIISAMYTPQKMNISEKAFQEQSLDGFSRLNKIQRELSEQFNMNPILTTRLSSEIISELTTESMKKLKQMEDED